MPKCNWQK